MSIFSRFLPKRKPPELKNNIPKEKENIRKTFGIYCKKHHGPKEGKLCPSCTALLATVFTKMDRCPYGITKPICDMTIKHKIAGMGVDYAKQQQEKKASDRVKAKEKAAKERAKEKEKKNNE